MHAGGKDRVLGFLITSEGVWAYNYESIGATGLHSVPMVPMIQVIRTTKLCTAHIDNPVWRSLRYTPHVTESIRCRPILRDVYSKRSAHRTRQVGAAQVRSRFVTAKRRHELRQLRCLRLRHVAGNIFAEVQTCACTHIRVPVARMEQAPHPRLSFPSVCNAAAAALRILEIVRNHRPPGCRLVGPGGVMLHASAVERTGR
jgi:hypothetical protein